MFGRLIVDTYFDCKIPVRNLVQQSVPPLDTSNLTLFCKFSLIEGQTAGRTKSKMAGQTKTHRQTYIHTVCTSNRLHLSAYYAFDGIVGYLDRQTDRQAEVRTQRWIDAHTDIYKVHL